MPRTYTPSQHQKVIEKAPNCQTLEDVEMLAAELGLSPWRVYDLARHLHVWPPHLGVHGLSTLARPVQLSA